MEPTLAAWLVPDPELADLDPGTLAEAFGRYRAAQLHLASLQRSALENYLFLASLAQRSGAMAFLALQAFVAAPLLPPGHSEPTGVAFGHLRAPERRALWLDAGGIQGDVPWFTGAHVFGWTVLGYHDGDDEVRALVRAEDRDPFRHSRPLPLAVMGSTQTVRVAVRNLRSGLELARAPKGTMAEADRLGVVWQTPLMLGVAKEAARWVLESSVDLQLKDGLAARVQGLETRLIRAIELGCDASDGLRLRTIAGEMAVKVARIAALATGGQSLMVGHPVERLYREALLVNLMAQTPTIVEDALLAEVE